MTHSARAKFGRMSARAKKLLLLRIYMYAVASGNRHLLKMLHVKPTHEMRRHRKKHRKHRRGRRRKGQGHRSRKHGSKMTKAERRRIFFKNLPKINAARRRKGLKPIHPKR